MQAEFDIIEIDPAVQEKLNKLQTIYDGLVENYTTSMGKVTSVKERYNHSLNSHIQYTFGEIGKLLSSFEFYRIHVPSPNNPLHKYNLQQLSRRVQFCRFRPRSWQSGNCRCVMLQFQRGLRN